MTIINNTGIKYFSLKPEKSLPSGQRTFRSIESKPSYPAELIGTGKEKRVYTTGEDRVRMTAQPGRTAALAEEAEKIAEIQKKNPDSQNLCIDMAADPNKENEYLAAQCKGDFSETLESSISFPQALDFARHLLNGLTELHAAGYAHGDLKPDNVLEFEKEGKRILKLSDFGKSKPLQLNESAIMLGNSRFSPPEQRLSFKGDVYGMGLLLIRNFEAALSIKPANSIEQLFPKSRVFAVFSRVVSSPFGGIALTTPQPAIHAHIDTLPDLSIDLKKLLRDMTNDDPAQRPTAEEALSRLKAAKQS